VRHGKVARDAVLEEIARVEAPEEAKEIFIEVALADEFVEFLTLPAYDRLG
jgi:hypothetical protein